ncbi:MAG: TlpA disulfide reductase family protein [Acidobacteriaceae bacterium]
MRRALPLLASLLVLLSGLLPPLHAQSSARLPGCEVNPDVQNVIDRELDPKLLDRMPFADRFPRERNTLEALISKYPRELEPYTRLRDLFFRFSPKEYAGLSQAWIKMGKEHPDDPLALLLASEVLNRVDTPESIRLLQSARAEAPEFPWAARDLAGIYSDGKRADPAKAKENIDAFFAICPASPDPYAQYWLPKADPLLQPKVEAARDVAQRAKLEKETDPQQLKSYSTLWTLEFQIRKPQEYEAERHQIAEDLARIEKIHPKGDAEWQALLIDGYQRSGAPKEKIAALEDGLIAEYPHSNQAYLIVSGRWDKAHPEPQDQRDAAAWDRHRKEYAEALQGWIRDYPDDSYLQRNAWFKAVQIGTIPDTDPVAAVDAFLRAMETWEGPSWGWYYLQAAGVLVDRGREPDRAIDLMKQATSSSKNNWPIFAISDDLTDEQRKERRDEQLQSEQDINGWMLKAAIEADKPEIAAGLRVAVEAPPPENKKSLEGYWTNRARFALLTGKRIDALAWYQMALQTRLEAPRPFEGRVRDDLADEAHALWKQQGGTETAWETWSRIPAADKTILAAGPWEKPNKSLPAFELTDLAGKTWRLKELNGKSVLIDVWATWCEGCLMELPNLEKLYEQVKNRNDIQILTFVSDDDPGVVGPFLKGKGYTFPVLPIVNDGAIDDAMNLPGGGIPQTWILDRSGTSVWWRLGYDPGDYGDFSRDMLTRLGVVAANQ